MKVKPSSMYECLHLDPNYMAMTVQNLMTVSESFHLLDIHKDELLNDLQVKLWMQQNTNLKFSRIVTLFELLDCNSTGFFDFDMYYFFTAIMVCVKNGNEKEFINRHARSVYNLFEVRMKGKMTHDQFAMVGWLFGFDKRIIKHFHKEFDISTYKRTMFDEFKFFILICLQLQDTLDKVERVRAYREYRERLVERLKPRLIKYWKYDIEPTPYTICRDVRYTQRPYLLRGRNVRHLNIFKKLRKYFLRRIRISSEKHPTICQCCAKCSNLCCKRTKVVHRDIRHKAKTTTSNKCCICCSKRKHRRIGWGEDNQIVLEKHRHEEVNTASRMPSWIEHMDAVKQAKHKSSRKNLLAFFGFKKAEQQTELEDLQFLGEKKQEDEKKHKRHHRHYHHRHHHRSNEEEQDTNPQETAQEPDPQAPDEN